MNTNTEVVVALLSFLAYSVGWSITTGLVYYYCRNYSRIATQNETLAAVLLAIIWPFSLWPTIGLLVGNIKKKR